MQKIVVHGITVGFVFGLLLSGSQALAGWMATSDFTGCPSNITATSGSEGPFASESDCLSRVRQAEASQNMSCVRYRCLSQGGEGSTPQAGHEMDEHIGKAIGAGITGDINAADAIGLATIGIGINAAFAPSAPQKPKTAAEMEADRVAAERAAIENARQVRINEERKDARLQPIFALLDPLPSAQAPQPPRSNFYTKGFEHASQCVSQNAGTSCVGVPASEMESCVADYRAGYEAANIKVKMEMEEAYQIGSKAAAKDEYAVGRSDPRAPEGPCRNEWIINFERGHGQAKRQKSVK